MKVLRTSCCRTTGNSQFFYFQNVLSLKSSFTKLAGCLRFSSDALQILVQSKPTQYCSDGLPQVEFAVTLKCFEMFKGEGQQGPTLHESWPETGANIVNKHNATSRFEDTQFERGCDTKRPQICHIFNIKTVIFLFQYYYGCNSVLINLILQCCRMTFVLQYPELDWTVK